MTQAARRGRPPIHGERMTAAERQAKKRTARLLAIERMRISITEAQGDLRLADPTQADTHIQSALEQLDLLRMDLDDL